ncbi:hypothetical protein [Methylomarinum vadi]|uniref:hypothetical protein n=1 Tax=Methylomarinum vadi TaxID=438855 RepID=UPI000561CC41|nr:hypothetical protein [Methylomarinum vadi]
MKAALSRSVIFVLAMFMFACASTGEKRTAQEVTFTPKNLRASGKAVIPVDASLTKAQRRLAAKQAAKMNAYRSLASLLYQEQLSGGMTVGGRVISNESHRVYVDTFLREAKVDFMRDFGNQLHTVLSLALTDRFYRCMSGPEEVVRLCLLEDNKMPFTRLGYNSAEVKTVNLACGTADCKGMLSVQGFSNGKNAFDRTLLNAGLYDGEWMVNSAGRLLVNFILLNNIPEL